MCWTVQTFGEKLYFGSDAKGYGFTVEGPTWHGIRSWMSATTLNPGVSCVAANADPCANRGQTYRGGLMLDMGALLPTYTLQPYVALGAGYATRRSRSWFFSPGGGLVIRTGPYVGLRIGASWGERPLDERREMVEAGLRLM